MLVNGEKRQLGQEFLFLLLVQFLLRCNETEVSSLGLHIVYPKLVEDLLLSPARDEFPPPFLGSSTLAVRNFIKFRRVVKRRSWRPTMSPKPVVIETQSHCLRNLS